MVAVVRRQFRFRVRDNRTPRVPDKPPSKAAVAFSACTSEVEKFTTALSFAAKQYESFEHTDENDARSISSLLHTRAILYCTKIAIECVLVKRPQKNNAR